MTTPASHPTTLPRTLVSNLAHFIFVILPLSLVTAVITADMSNLDFVHLVQLRTPVSANSMILPSDDALNVDQLRWTFLQSAYLLPLMLLAGPVLILQFVLLVGRLRRSRLADGLSWTLAATVAVVGLMTLLNAFAGESVVGVILTKMAASVVVASALGLVAQAVELIPSTTERTGQAAFPTVTFATIYGLGTAFASSSTVTGYQLAHLLQRHDITFEGAGTGETKGFRGLFLLEGLFFLALCPIIGILLMLASRLGRRSSLGVRSQHAVEMIGIVPQALSTAQTGREEKADVKTSDALLGDNPTDTEGSHATASSAILDGSDGITSAEKGGSVDEHQDKDKHEMMSFATMRRLSSYCTSPLTGISILRRNDSGQVDTQSTGALNRLRSLQQLHTGLGLWVSAVLRRIMVFVYGGMGVDDAAFDLISMGTSSRETFICGVLIVSNTVIVQLAVVSLIAPLKAPDAQQAGLQPQLKIVPALPGLPTLAGGVSGSISAVGWSLMATKGCGKGRLGRWKDTRWWVPALLTACLVVTLIGLGLAVVASIMVPDATCGSWIMYVATAVTYAGSIPQLPLALQQIYTVLDAELGHPDPHTPSFQPAATINDPETAPQPTAVTAPSVQAIRWERVGAMISTLTTIAGSELLTAWVFLMPDAAQKAFLFTSAVLAIGGCVWLMVRHTRPVVARVAVAGSDS